MTCPKSCCGGNRSQVTPGRALRSLLSSRCAADSSPLAPQPGSQLLHDQSAAPLAPTLPSISGNTHRVKGEGDTGQQKGLSGGLGVILALPLLLSLISSQPPVLGAARPGTESFLPALATQKAAKGSSLLQSTPAWARVFLAALSTGQAAALTSPAGGEVLLVGTSPWPQPHPPHALAEAPEPGGEGCPEGVHMWLAVKAGEPSSSCTQHLSFPQDRPAGAHGHPAAWTARRVHPAARPGGVKVCLDPCWGEQWGWLREEGHRQPALGLVCTMHEALAGWREEVPALLGCSI